MAVIAAAPASTVTGLRHGDGAPMHMQLDQCKFDYMHEHSLESVLYRRTYVHEQLLGECSRRKYLEAGIKSKETGKSGCSFVVKCQQAGATCLP